MTTPRTRAIVNPNSSHGRTRHNWPKMHQALEAALGPVEVAFTGAQMAATQLTREALQDGVDLIIAVGGDGTVNEVVNGFFLPPTGPENTLVRPEAELALHAGDHVGFLSLVNLSVETFAARGDTRNACLCRADMGRAYLALGAYGRAERELRSAIGVGEPMRLGFLVPVRANLALVNDDGTVSGVLAPPMNCCVTVSVMLVTAPPVGLP